MPSVRVAVILFLVLFAFQLLINFDTTTDQHFNIFDLLNMLSDIIFPFVEKKENVMTIQISVAYNSGVVLCIMLRH